jgi:predicted Zn-dependent protease
MSTRSIAFVAILLLTGGALVLTQRRKADAPAGPEAVSNFIASSEREMSRLPARFTRLSDEEEIAAGDRLVGLAAHSNSPTTEKYLQAVGARVARGAHRKLPYRFHYWSEPTFVNAFALPGGHIVVGQGLLELMDSEDELASVLGHEIEHVNLYHCAERLQVEAAIRKVPLGGITWLPIMLFQAGYHKDQELEADRAGLQLAVLAGYSPGGALRFEEKFERLYQRYVKGKQPKAGSPVDEILVGSVSVLRDYFRTHPPPSERLDQMHRLIDSNHWDATKPETDLRIGWIFWKERAKRAYESQRYEVAAAWAERTLKTEPRQPEALQVLAESRMAMAEFPASSAAFKKLLEINPENLKAMQHYADALGASKNANQAVAEFRAWASKTTLPQARTEVAGLAAMAGELGPSQSALAQAHSGEDGWDRDGILRLATWHYRAARFDTAEALMNYLLPAQGNKTRPSDTLAWLLIERNQYQEALWDFDGDAEGRVGRAVVQWRTLDLDSALSGFDRVAASDPSWRNPRWVAGFFTPGVVETISQMLRAQVNLARELKQRGELPEVIEILNHAVNFSQVESALRLDPHSAEGWLLHGRFAVRGAYYDVAKKDFEKVISFEPKRFEAYTELDAMLARDAQFTRMIGFWSGYIPLVPDDGRGWLGRARNHARAGDLRAAALDAEQACKRNNQDGCQLQQEYRAKVRD